MKHPTTSSAIVANFIPDLPGRFRLDGGADCPMRHALTSLNHGRGRFAPFDRHARYASDGTCQDRTSQVGAIHYFSLPEKLFSVILDGHFSTAGPFPRARK